MKYRIDEFDELIIRNDSGMRIFGINKYDRWIKYEFDRHGNEIYRVGTGGPTINYEDV